MQRRHATLDRITFDPEQCEGRACIRGLRFPVASLLGYLAAGMTVQEVLAEWPDLEETDIRQALAYAAWSAGERVLNVA